MVDRDDRNASWALREALTASTMENPIAAGDRKDFVALVNLAHYYSFITDENGSLRKYIFESNVRDYQGHNNVNNEIHNTLSEDTTEDFWWLNNGVTILASDISQTTPRQLLITNPEIVNGLQTSNEICRFFKEHPEKLTKENRNILLRIIVPENETSRDRIILATNSQTAIPPVALRSTDLLTCLTCFVGLTGLTGCSSSGDTGKGTVAASASAAPTAPVIEDRKSVV